MVNNFAYITKILNLKEDLIKSLEFIQWNKHVNNDSTVFIKPNFTYPFHKPGITTTPQLLEYLLEIMKDKAERVIIGESDGGNRSFTADDSFRGRNMADICRKTGAELVNLSKMPYKNVEDTIQGKKIRVQVPEFLIDDVNCFVSVPVLKVHAMTKITLSIKNLWGCYPDTMRCLHHKNLSHKLTLLTKILNPKLIIIDGIYGLNNHGPMHGNPVKTDLLIVADNPVVADSLGAKIMGFDPKNVEHILLAEKEGLGSTSIEQYRLNQNWNQYRVNFSLDKTINDRLSYLLFNNETVPKLIMDSALTPMFYKLVDHLRNNDEKRVVEEIKNRSK